MKYNMNNLPISRINNLIDEWIHDKKHREILRMRLIDNETYESIAESVDLSVNQVKSIVYSDVRELKRIDEETKKLADNVG